MFNQVLMIFISVPRLSSANVEVIGIYNKCILSALWRSGHRPEARELAAGGPRENVAGPQERFWISTWDLCSKI